MIRFPEPESIMLEFKRDIPRNNQIVKTIIGFCNTYGGRLVLGVENDGQIVGIPQDVIEDARESIEQTIFDSCSPPIIARIYTELYADKTILVIEVSEGMNKPYYLRSEGGKSGVYIRLNRHTMPAPEDYIKELFWKSHGIDYERMPLQNATIDDLNLVGIQNFLKNRKNKGATLAEDAILHSYGIITYEHGRKCPSILGVLLFGTNPQFYLSEAMIICTHFNGIEGREAIASVDCEGTLFNQYHQAYNFLRQRLYYSFSIPGSKREEELEIPDVALREALLNLIVHRNYHMKSPSKIAIYDDRIEFFSPGSFPGPIVIEKIRSGISYLRNPAICKIFREANYIEKPGTGFITIFNSYEIRKLKEPQVVNGGDHIKCILPRIKEAVIIPDVIDDYFLILTLLQKKEEVNANEVAQHLNISNSSAVRRLNDLLSNGQITRTGKGKNSRYKIAQGNS